MCSLDLRIKFIDASVFYPLSKDKLHLELQYLEFIAHSCSSLSMSEMPDGFTWNFPSDSSLVSDWIHAVNPFWLFSADFLSKFAPECHGGSGSDNVARPFIKNLEVPFKK